MQLERFAVVSDIHGNLLALDAVLQDISERDVTTVVNLGDHLYGPLDPLATADRLMRFDWINIAGNCDRFLIDDSQLPENSTAARNRRMLNSSIRQWLQNQSCVMQIGDVVLCHGTPEADDVYLLEQITNGRNQLRPASEIEQIIHAQKFSLLLCGHTHVPRTVALAGGSLLVNPGSVGLPAYTEENPALHRMEAGSPHSRYAMIERQKNGWKVEHIDVLYDWSRAAQMAYSNGRDDWAEWLVSGRA